MRIALVYWGILRAADKTHDNREQNIYAPLRENGVEYKIYCHNYHLNQKYVNHRAKEKPTTIDENKQKKLLKPDYYLVDDRDVIIKSLQENMKTYLRHGNPWAKDTGGSDTFLYHMLAMYSKHEITKLLEQHIYDGEKYDFVMFLRSDVIFEPFNIMTIIRRLKGSGKNTVILPNFGHCPKWGYNDRYILCYPEMALEYGLIYRDMIDIVNQPKKTPLSPLHSETLVKYILDQAKANVIIDSSIKFCRIRTNGFIHKNDIHNGVWR